MGNILVTGKGEFLQPTDLVLDNLGYLFVLDSAYSKIQKFQTPFVLKIQEALAAEQAKKLEELAYLEASSDSRGTEPSEEISVPEEPAVVRHC